MPEPAQSGHTVLGGLVLAGLLLGAAAAAGSRVPATGRLDGAEAWSSRTRPGRATSSSRTAATPSCARSSMPPPRGWPSGPETPDAADRGPGDDRRPGPRRHDRHPRGPRDDARPRAARPERVDRVHRGRTRPPAGPGGRIPGGTPRPGRRRRRGEPGRALRRRTGGSDSTGAPTAHAYRLPGGSRRAAGDEQDTLLDELGLPIRRRLLGCPPGGSRSSRGRRPGLAQLRADRLRQPRAGAGSWGVPAGARVGDVLTTDDGSFLLTRRGPGRAHRRRTRGLPPRDHAAWPAHRRVVPHRSRAPRARRRRRAPVGRAREPYLSAHWPASRLSPVPAGRVPS